MTDLFFRSLEDLKNRIQIQSSLGGELFLCKRMEICYNKKRDDTKREVLNMAKDERNAYTIQNDASLGEVKIADEVVAIIAALAATEVDGVASMAGNITNEVIGKLPYIKVTQDRCVLEIQRGCIRGCRYSISGIKPEI